MEDHGLNLLTPKAPSKKPHRHSLQPQIFLQLEFSSPTGKTIDASRIGVLNQGWKDAPHAPSVCETYLTHVRVEHCQNLSSDPANQISDIGGSTLNHHHAMNVTGSKYVEPKTESEEKSPDFPEGEIGSEVNPSLSSSQVLPSKGMGRHDHLLDPLPNELFEVVPASLALQSDHVMTESESKVASVVGTLSGSDIVDVRECDLTLFAMIEPSETPEDVDAPATPRRTSRKGKHPRRRHSSTAIEIPESHTNDVLTPKRGSKKVVGAERVRSRSSTNARRRHSTGHERSELNTSSSHRKSSSKCSPNQCHRHRSEGSKDIETLNPKRPSSRKSITKDESEGKPSSYRARRRHQSNEANECIDVSRRRSGLT